MTIGEGNFPPNSSIYIEPGSDRETEYCRRHGMVLRRFDNGATLVGTSRLVTDSSRAWVYLTYPDGSYHDPQGKKGLAHLVEHILAHPTHVLARRYDVDLNAATSPVNMQMTIQGPVLPQVTDYGVPPVLPFLAKPATLLDDSQLEQRIIAERGNISMEIAETDASHYGQVSRAYRRLVFHPDNPASQENLDTPATLATITRADVLEFVERTFSPHDLVIGAHSEGRKEVGRLLTGQLTTIFSGLPQRAVSSRRINRELFDKIHPDFSQGCLFKHDTGLNNKLVTAFFVWDVDLEGHYSPESWALDRIIREADIRLTDFFRSEGWGYTSQAELAVPGETKGIVSLAMTIGNQPDLKTRLRHDYGPRVIKSVIGGIDDQVIASMTFREQMRQQLPLSTSILQQLSETGLTSRKQLIDVDLIRARLAQINEEHFRFWRNHLLTVEPAIIAVGDLG